MEYTKEHKALLLNILEAQDFNVKKSAEEFNKQTGCKLHRTSIYDWIAKDELFSTQYELRKNELLDEAENVHRLIRQGIPLIDELTGKIIAWQEKPDRAAIEFFLRAKGSARGYHADDKIKHEIEIKKPFTLTINDEEIDL